MAHDVIAAAYERVEQVERASADLEGGLGQSQECGTISHQFTYRDLRKSRLGGLNGTV